MLIFRKLRQENTGIHIVICLKISIPMPIENIGRQSNAKQIIQAEKYMKNLFKYPNALE